MWSVRTTARQRDRTVSALGSAYATGALSTGTFELRLERAFGARSRAQLRALVADLPGLAGLTARLRTRGAPPATAASALLVTLPDRPRMLVGRAGTCEVVLADPTVSRRHASLRRHGGGWEVCDLGSTNGTFVNGSRVARAEVGPGDELRFGMQLTRLA